MNHHFIRSNANALLGILLLAPVVAAQPAAATGSAAATPAPATPAPAPAAPAAAPAAAAASAAPAPASAAAPSAAPAPAAAPAAAPAPATAAAAAPSAAAPTPLPLAPLPQFEFAEPSPPLEPDIPIQTRDIPPVTPLLELWIGFHNQLVGTTGLDPFSENDQVPSFHIGASLGVSKLDSGQIALVANADFGGTDSSLRGQATDLSVQRYGLGPELRFPLLDRLYVFGRLAPQALHVSTELGDAASGVRLGDDQWTFALDAAIGASVRIAAVRPAGADHPLGMFLRIEAGYLWSPALDLELSPVAGRAPVRTAPLDFGELALRGVSIGGALGVGY